MMATGHNDFERRLAALERELGQARQNVHDLTRAARAARASRRAWAIVTVVCLAAVIPWRHGVLAQNTPQNLQLPLVVMDKRGQPVLRIDETGTTVRGVLRLITDAGEEYASLDRGVFQLGNPEKGGIVAGVGASGSGFVNVRTANGKDGVALGRYRNGPLGVHVLGPDGTTTQARLVIDDRLHGQLSLGAEKEGGIVFGVGVSGAGYGMFRGNAGTETLRIGAYKGGPFSISVLGADGDTPQASLGLDDMQKGILRIGDARGPRGVLGATKTGGVSFALYDGPGTDYRVGLYTSPASSFIRMNSQKNGVDVNAASTGASVQVFNALGNPAASLLAGANGYGQLSLTSPSGDKLVEAGVTVDGVGIVRVGPRMGGTSGVSQGGLVLPHAIVGQKGK